MAAQEPLNELEEIAQTIKAEGRLGRKVLAGFLAPPVVALATMLISGQVPVTGQAWESFSDGVLAMAGEKEVPVSDEIQFAGHEPVWLEQPSEDVIPADFGVAHVEQEFDHAIDDKAQQLVIWIREANIEALECREAVLRLEEKTRRLRAADSVDRSS